MKQKRFTWKPWVIVWAVLTVGNIISQVILDFFPATDFPPATVSTVLLAPFASALLLAILYVVFGFYFLPTILAKQRQQENDQIIFALNLVLGWTVLFWVVCLFWAILGETKQVGKKCPACAEMVKLEASVCKHCTYEF